MPYAALSSRWHSVTAAKVRVPDKDKTDEPKSFIHIEALNHFLVGRVTKLTPNIRLFRRADCGRKVKKGLWVKKIDNSEV